MFVQHVFTRCWSLWPEVCECVYFLQSKILEAVFTVYVFKRTPAHFPHYIRSTRSVTSFLLQLLHSPNHSTRQKQSTCLQLFHSTPITSLAPNHSTRPQTFHSSPNIPLAPNLSTRPADTTHQFTPQVLSTQQLTILTWLIEVQSLASLPTSSANRWWRGEDLTPGHLGAYIAMDSRSLDSQKTDTKVHLCALFFNVLSSHKIVIRFQPSTWWASKCTAEHRRITRGTAPWLMDITRPLHVQNILRLPEE